MKFINYFVSNCNQTSSNPYILRHCFNKHFFCSILLNDAQNGWKIKMQQHFRKKAMCSTNAVKKSHLIYYFKGNVNKKNQHIIFNVIFLFFSSLFTFHRNSFVALNIYIAKASIYFVINQRYSQSHILHLQWILCIQLFGGIFHFSPLSRFIIRVQCVTSKVYIHVNKCWKKGKYMKKKKKLLLTKQRNMIWWSFSKWLAVPG